jgi:hypothetical protein
MFWNLFSYLITYNLYAVYKDRHAALFIKFDGETLGTAQINRSNFSSVRAT